MAKDPYADLFRFVAQAESGGRDYDASGRVITSPKGAKGMMQVMDATNLDPGYGVRPAQDDSLAERTRVGQDYLKAMIGNYGGDLIKGLAAYNAGPGNVDRALAAAQKAGSQDWMAFLPKPDETVPYVKRIVGNMAAEPGMLDRIASAVLPSAQAQPVPDKLAADPLFQMLSGSPQGSTETSEKLSADPVWQMLNEGPKVSESRSPDGALRVEMGGTSTSTSGAEPSTVAERVGYGLLDPFNKGAQLLAHALPDTAVNAVNSATQYLNDLPVIGPATKALGMTPSTPEQLDQSIAAGERAYEASRAAAGSTGFDWARFGGNVLGSAPLAAFAPAGGAAGLASAAGRGAVGGALGGLFAPVTSGNSEDFWRTTAQQAATGALGGAVLGPVFNQLGRVISPNVSQDVQALRSAGVNPTPGQILGGGWARTEEKLGSVPILGDFIKGAQGRAVREFNEAAYNQALAPIGKKFSGEVGQEGIDKISRLIGDAYDDVLPKMRLHADPQFQQEVVNLSQLAGGLPKAQQDQFMNIVRSQIGAKMSPAGYMDGKTLKGVQSELGRIAKGYLGDSSFDQRMLGQAVQELRDTVDRTLMRTNPPELAQQLQNANQAWANFVRLRAAAATQGAANNEGVFTAAQLSNAVRSADKSVGKGDFAKGRALMQDLAGAGQRVLGSKYPDSGTAGRGSLLAALASVPATAYAPTATLAALGGIGVGSLPYARLGQRLIASALTSRPQVAQPIGQFVNRLGTVGLPGGLMSLLAAGKP